jgi:hypothetical protein
MDAITADSFLVNFLRSRFPSVYDINDVIPILGLDRTDLGPSFAAFVARSIMDSAEKGEVHLVRRPGRLPKICLVTVGATAPFRQLLEAVIQLTFLEFMWTRGFTEIRVQCGKDLAWFQDACKTLQPFPNMTIAPFDMDENLPIMMADCRGELSVRESGVVICHCGMSFYFSDFN